MRPKVKVITTEQRLQEDIYRKILSKKEDIQRAQGELKALTEVHNTLNKLVGDRRNLLQERKKQERITERNQSVMKAMEESDE